MLTTNAMRTAWGRIASEHGHLLARSVTNVAWKAARLPSSRYFSVSHGVAQRGGGGGSGNWLSSRPPPLPYNTVIKFVPQQQSWVVERFGRFSHILEPGLALLIPFVDRIAYVHSLKEVAAPSEANTAITLDNVSIELDGVLYYRIVDPYKASYGVERPHFAISQLAQTIMRAEIGRLSLDRLLAERAALNARIVEAIGSACEAWGIQCLRYEVRDIHLPPSVVQAMHSQVSAERSKRALILESEGQRQAEINVAEGKKQSAILRSEADKATAINLAQGAAESIRLGADAKAQSIARVATAITHGDGAGGSGADAASLQVAERWVEAWSGIARNAGSVVVVPSGMGDAAAMVTQGLSLFRAIPKSFGSGGLNASVPPSSGGGTHPTTVTSSSSPGVPPSGDQRKSFETSQEGPSGGGFSASMPALSSQGMHGSVRELNEEIFGKTFQTQ